MKYASFSKQDVSMLVFDSFFLQIQSRKCYELSGMKEHVNLSFEENRNTSVVKVFRVTASVWNSSHAEAVLNY